MMANHEVPSPPLLLRVLDDVSGPLGGPHVPLQFFYFFIFGCFSSFVVSFWWWYFLSGILYFSDVRLVSSAMQPGKNPIHVRVSQDFHLSLFPTMIDRSRSLGLVPLLLLLRLKFSLTQQLSSFYFPTAAGRDSSVRVRFRDEGHPSCLSFFFSSQTFLAVS